MERTYEELRLRKIKTEEAIKRIRDFTESIAKWKEEEEEIGTNKYPVYEVLRSIVPEIDKKKAVSFVDNLLTRLEGRKLIFKDWQVQREIRRKVKAELRLQLLAEFKNYKNKLDKMTDGVFEALEGLKWS